jgi:antitoxin component of MazEF toxin-antitoxin module
MSKMIIGENDRIPVPPDVLKKLKLKQGSAITIKAMIGPNGKTENLKAMIGPNGMIQIPKDIITKLGLKKGGNVEIIWH